MDDFHRAVAERIRALIRKRKLSQNVLADLAGVGRGQMTAILRAKASPTLRTLKKIADALEVDVRDLLPSSK
ncbi:MAG TPA: helix-turn-helix transcriptional regulator [Rudaea sp.]|nr:helix-turn-helix transcriptional regulator [Rudaea sp.]